VSTSERGGVRLRLTMYLRGGTMGLGREHACLGLQKIW